VQSVEHFCSILPDFNRQRVARSLSDSWASCTFMSWYFTACCNLCLSIQDYKFLTYGKVTACGNGSVVGHTNEVAVRRAGLVNGMGDQVTYANSASYPQRDGKMSTGQRAVTLCGCGGNRRSGIALAMRHRLYQFIHLRAQGLRKGDEHSAYTPHGYGTFYLTTYIYRSLFTNLS